MEGAETPRAKRKVKSNEDEDFVYESKRAKSSRQASGSKVKETTIQYSPDNLTLANSHAPDYLHSSPGHNSLSLMAYVKLPF